MSSLTVPQLKKFLAEDPELIIIDIRTQWELKDGKIPKAESMDVSSKSFISDVTKLPKGKTYCLYCASGGRTSMIVPFMKDLGFSKVYDLEGGIMSWIMGGNPLEK